MLIFLPGDEDCTPSGEGGALRQRQTFLRISSYVRSVTICVFCVKVAKSNSCRDRSPPMTKISCYLRISSMEEIFSRIIFKREGAKVSCLRLLKLHQFVVAHCNWQMFLSPSTHCNWSFFLNFFDFAFHNSNVAWLNLQFCSSSNTFCFFFFKICFKLQFFFDFDLGRILFFFFRSAAQDLRSGHVSWAVASGKIKNQRSKESSSKSNSLAKLGHFFLAAKVFDIYAKFEKNSWIFLRGVFESSAFSQLKNDVRKEQRSRSRNAKHILVTFCRWSIINNSIL